MILNGKLNKFRAITIVVEAWLNMFRYFIHYIEHRAHTQAHTRAHTYFFHILNGKIVTYVACLGGFSKL